MSWVGFVTVLFLDQCDLDVTAFARFVGYVPPRVTERRLECSAMS
jgi:hypothetical protein